MRKWLILALSICAGFLRAAPEPLGSSPALAAPRISPDYSDLVLPPNIAPLNFQIKETGRAFRAVIRSKNGPGITVSSGDPSIRIPLKEWRALLAQNQGKPLVMDISARQATGDWRTWAPITNRIAVEPVDGYLVYRQLKPLYNLYSNVGIYQRDLAGFEQAEVLENERFEHGCLNCHTFLQHSPANMLLQVRSRQGNPMLVMQNGQITNIALAAGYSSWHPGGRLIAYSVNKLSLVFHTVGETRDVHDADSNVHVYRLDSNTVVTPPDIALANRLETWPCWSPDGRHLYYCSTEKLPEERFREVRYDLMRVAYDIEKNAWGTPENLVPALATGLSAAQPRVSPDGRWLAFTLCKYGHFPIYQPKADLYLMDLASREYRRLEINSDQSDSWHCWSSNGRWLVFSSKRRDGVFTRPYFAFMDEQGRFSKPFILPQEDPAFYDAFLKNFNVPELIKAPIPVKPGDWAKAIMAPAAKIQPLQESAQTPVVNQVVDEGVTSGANRK